MDKIIIKNTSSATLCLSYPNVNFRTVLLPNRKILITQQVYDEMRYDAGTEQLLSSGALKVTIGEEAEKKKNLEEILEEAAAIPVEESPTGGKIVMSRDEVVKLLQEGTISQFTNTIKKASPSTLEIIAQVAIEFSVADGAHTELIKKYCGVDVIKALSLKPTKE